MNVHVGTTNSTYDQKVVASELIGKECVNEDNSRLAFLEALFHLLGHEENLVYLQVIHDGLTSQVMRPFFDIVFDPFDIVAFVDEVKTLAQVMEE